MGYLEAPLSLNPSDREPKTTIVARVMLGMVLTTVAELALPPRRRNTSGVKGRPDSWRTSWNRRSPPTAVIETIKRSPTGIDHSGQVRVEAPLPAITD